MAQISFASPVSDLTSVSTGSIRLNTSSRQKPIDLQRNIGFQASGFGLSRGQAISSQQQNRFVNENRDLLYVIDQSDEAKDFLKKTSVSTRADLVGVIADTAHSLLQEDAAKNLSSSYLKTQPVLASMIVLNTGNIRDKINTDPSASALLSIQGSVTPEQDAFDRVARKVAKLFTDSSSLHDETFWSAHPNAAVYMLRSPDMVTSFNHPADGETKAKIFKDNVERSDNQAAFDSITSHFAADSTKSGVYNQAFFEANKNVAQYVAASQYLTDVPSPSSYFKEHPEYNLQNKATGDSFNLGNIVGNTMASQARQLFDVSSPITTQFLQKNVGFSRLMLGQSDFRADMTSRKAQNDMAILFGAGQNSTSVSNQTLSQLGSRFHSTYEDLSPTYSIVA